MMSLSGCGTLVKVVSTKPGPIPTTEAGMECGHKSLLNNNIIVYSSAFLLRTCNYLLLGTMYNTTVFSTNLIFI